MFTSTRAGKGMMVSSAQFTQLHLLPCHTCPGICETLGWEDFCDDDFSLLQGFGNSWLLKIAIGAVPPPPHLPRLGDHSRVILSALRLRKTPWGWRITAEAFLLTWRCGKPLGSGDCYSNSLAGGGVPTPWSPRDYSSCNPQGPGGSCTPDP